MRIALACIGIAGALAVSAWIPFLCMIVLAIRWRAYEVLCMGMFVDFVWQPIGSAITIPLFTVAGIILVWGFEPLRREFLAH